MNFDANSNSDSACSQISSKNLKKDWRLLAKFETLDNYNNFLQLKMPYNVSRTSHMRTFCEYDKINKHKT